MALYNALSESYDLFFDKAYLNKIQKRYHNALMKNGIKSGKVLDAGCGTGMLSFYLYDKGYKVTGVDLSEEMLIKARKKSLENNVRIDWYNCDISKNLSLCKFFDAVVSSLDVANHITDINDLYRFFLNTYEVLNCKGLFVFDINSYKKFSKQYAQNKYVYSAHHSVCVWKNNYNFNTELCQMTVETYVKSSNGYKKKTDVFYERYYSLNQIINLLKKAGFKRVSYITVDKGTRHILTANK